MSVNICVQSKCTPVHELVFLRIGDFSRNLCTQKCKVYFDSRIFFLWKNSFTIVCVAIGDDCTQCTHNLRGKKLILNFFLE